MSKNIIHLDNISKTFRVAERGSSSKEVLESFFKKRYREVNALSNVSFDIDEGEIVGYIGPNGARQIYHNKNYVWHFES